VLARSERVSLIKVDCTDPESRVEILPELASLNDDEVPLDSLLASCKTPYTDAYAIEG